MRRQRNFAPRESLLKNYSQTLGELTRRRHTEQAIRAARIESDLANKAKSAFLATMSHELRTPLNAIIGFSDIIRATRGAGAEQNADHADHIAAAGRQLLKVVSDVLDISKMESGSFTLAAQPCDLSEIVESAVAETQDMIAAKKQKLETRLLAGLPVLTVDFKRIRQILVNLLSNASKFTAEGGRILIVAQPMPGSGVTIAVADTGIGMAREQLAVALKPFSQIQFSYDRAQEGTGLGLSIARGLAERHRGSLHIESEPGKGTTVFLNLPADIAMAVSQPQRAAS